MKKIALILSAMALLATVSCNKQGQEKPNLDDVVEDGFFVAGPATGTSELSAKYMMTAGFNEVTKQARDGMYEKYVILNAGQDFYLTLNEAGNSTRYSAELQDIDLAEKVGEAAYADNPKIVIQKGKLESGEAAKAMQVKKTGLYHIVLDLNKAEDLEFPQIIVVPCEWRMKGQLEKAMEAKVDGDKYIYTWQGEGHQDPSSFKFAYCDGWKITLDVDGKVKAEVSLGMNANGALAPNGSDIPMNPGDDVKVSLVFQMASGEHGNSFSYKIEGVKENYGPADFTVGLSGDLHANVPSWATPSGVTKGVYDEKASNPASNTYVYNVTGCPIKADAQFKFRKDGDWIGSGASYVKVEGVSVSGSDNFVFGSEAGTYNIKITLVWDGKSITSYKAEFKRTGDLPAVVEKNPEDIIVGMSGNFAGKDEWGDAVGPVEKNRAAYAKSLSDESTKHYVYELKDFVLTEGDVLKFRFDGSYEGFGFAPIDGVTLVQAPADGNLLVDAAAAGKYDIQFSFDLKDNVCTNKAVKFTKK